MTSALQINVFFAAIHFVKNITSLEAGYILRCIAGVVPLGMGCAQMPHFHTEITKNKIQRIFDEIGKTTGFVGLARLDSEITACLTKSFRRRQGGAPPRVARSWDRGGDAEPRRGG